MDEAAALADKVGIIDRGKIVIEGSPDELINKMGADNIKIQGTGNIKEFLKNIEKLSYVENIDTSNHILQIGVDNGNQRLVEVVKIANDNGFSIEDISVSKPDLGDVFLKHTGRQLRDK